MSFEALSEPPCPPKPKDNTQIWLENCTRPTGEKVIHIKVQLEGRYKTRQTIAVISEKGIKLIKHVDGSFNVAIDRNNHFKMKLLE